MPFWLNCAPVVRLRTLPGMATAAAAAAACERKASLDSLGLPPKQQQPSGQAKKNRAKLGEVAKRTS